MADASLYLFDGYNLLHASPFREARELIEGMSRAVLIYAEANAGWQPDGQALRPELLHLAVRR